MPKIYLLLVVLLLTNACKKEQGGNTVYDEKQTTSEAKEEQQTETAAPASGTGTNVGDVAPEISLPDPNGNIISLSSLRGKYVLIDFWASWCGPCRRENPNVVRVYKEYKDKGLEIYGVSLDMNKGLWLQAIEADQLTWKHVSDLAYWNSVVVPTYEINGIPATFLLDKDGKIIAKNLRGEALESKLKEVLN